MCQLGVHMSNAARIRVHVHTCVTLLAQWSHDALSGQQLMDLPLTALTAAQVAQIGHSGYLYLTQTKAKIQALRTKIAFHVPPIVNSPDCETPGTCLFTWNREREERVRVLIHHPEHPISCLVLLDQLRNVYVPGLCDGCQDLTVRWIWGKCLLTQEETLIDEAVASLMVLQVEQPLRQALRESVINCISY
ncbi:hypothetical protein B0H14DRAFT_3592498 [Mycena olivaceomarginata]|nr:hypothetical protein B0H14DRAFT_3592498 [Mycena olivaceomarginata]